MTPLQSGAARGIIRFTELGIPGMKLQRKVGQLNFFDFLESVDVQDDNNNAANPNLVPPQSWLSELEFNRKLGAAGSMKLKLPFMPLIRSCKLTKWARYLISMMVQTCNKARSF